MTPLPHGCAVYKDPLPRLLYFRYLLRISIKMYDDPPLRFLLGPPDWDLGDPLPL